MGDGALEINFSLVPLVRLRRVCKCQLANTHLGDDIKCHLRCHNSGVLWRSNLQIRF